MRTLRSHSQRQSGHTRADRRRGAIVALAALLMAAMLGMVAFTFDLGRIVHVDTEIQRTADAVALAAVRYLPNKDLARTNGQVVALENLEIDGVSLTNGDFVFGTWDVKTATFNSATTADPNAVQVTVRRVRTRGTQLPLYFGAIFGRNDHEITARAIAYYDRSLCGGLVGIDWMDVPGDPYTDSYSSSAGTYDSQTPGDNGDICSDGPIALEGQPLINGDAQSGRGYQTTLEGSAVVTGTTSSRLRPLNLPPVDGTEASLNNNNANIPLAEKKDGTGNPTAAYDPISGDFLIEGEKTLTFPEGTYYFNDFTISGQSEIRVTGETTIYVTGNLDTSGGDMINESGIPSNMHILMTGGTGTTARVKASIDFYGLLYAPQTDVQIAGEADIYGSVVGQTLDFTGTGDVHYDEDLGLTRSIQAPKRVALVQ